MVNNLERTGKLKLKPIRGEAIRKTANSHKSSRMAAKGRGRGR